MSPSRSFEIFHSVFAYLKVYPNHAKLIEYDTPIQVRTAGFEERPTGTHSHRTPDEISSEMSFIESLRRTKTTISDLTICNNFDTFATFTFDPQKVNRTNPSECKRKMSKWLNNQRELHGKFGYLIVPEFHKDGKSLHFHALLKGYNGKLTDSGHRQKNRKVYNINSYRLGYSTAVKIDNIEKVSSYIKKYITKEMPKFPGQKRYWCSTELKRPIVVENPTIVDFTPEKDVQKWKVKNLTVATLPAMIQLPINNNAKEQIWTTRLNKTSTA